MHVTEQSSVCTTVQKGKLKNMEYNRNKNSLLWAGVQSYSQFALSIYIKKNHCNCTLHTHKRIPFSNSNFFCIKKKN